MQIPLAGVIFAEPVRPPGGGELKSYLTRERDQVELTITDGLLFIRKNGKTKVVGLSMVKEAEVLDGPQGPGVVKAKERTA